MSLRGQEKVHAALGVPTLEGSVPGLIFPKCCLAPGPCPLPPYPLAQGRELAGTKAPGAASACLNLKFPIRKVKTVILSSQG